MCYRIIETDGDPEALLSSASYNVLLAPAVFIVTLVYYYFTWLSWELFINN